MNNKEIEKKLVKWYREYCKENKKAPSWKELNEQEEYIIQGDREESKKETKQLLNNFYGQYVDTDNHYHIEVGGRGTGKIHHSKQMQLILIKKLINNLMLLEASTNKYSDFLLIINTLLDNYNNEIECTESYFRFVVEKVLAGLYHSEEENKI